MPRHFFYIVLLAKVRQPQRGAACGRLEAARRVFQRNHHDPKQALALQHRIRPVRDDGRVVCQPGQGQGAGRPNGTVRAP